MSKPQTPPQTPTQPQPETTPAALDRFSTRILATAQTTNPKAVNQLVRAGTLSQLLAENAQKAADHYEMLARDKVPDMEALTEACKMYPLVYLGDRD